MELADARLFKLASLLFDAALGKSYYDTFSSAANTLGIDALAQSWGASSLTGRLLGSDTTSQARALVERLGFDPDSTDSASADAIAHKFFKNNLDSGMNTGTLALAAIRYLEQDNLALGLNSASKHLYNRAEVAYQYSSEMGLSSVNVQDLQSVIDEVDENEESIQTALLSVSQDQFESIRDASKLAAYSGDDDSITGTTGSDYIDAGSGYDTVDGGEGNDILLGSSGDDEIQGGRGQDSIEGGDGSDTLKAGSYYDSEYHRGYYKETSSGSEWVSSYYTYEVDAHYEIINGGSGHDNIYGGYGSDYLTGGDGSDRIEGDDYTLSSSEFSNVSVSSQVRMYNDTIDGGAGADSIYGVNGNDSIIGGGGNDYLSAGSGNDTVTGGEGADSVYAGSGSDYVEGGVGNDLIYAATSYYLDDETSVDSIYGNEGDDRIYASNGDNVDAGVGNDRIDFVRSEHGGHGVVIAGEGQDTVDVDNDSSYSSNYRITTALTIDLNEEEQVRDLVYFDVASRDQHGVEIQGFDVNTDRIDLGQYYDIYDPENEYYKSTDNMQDFSYSGSTLTRNYVQIVSDTTTAWQKYSYSYGADNTPDSYGKAFFVIQGATIASSSTSDAATLIDAYGNNATYGESEDHLFLVNIANLGIGIFAFEDDTGANDRVVSDEIQLLGTLNGVYTEDITMNNANFFI